jgi:hypothetical protein
MFIRHLLFFLLSMSQSNGGLVELDESNFDTLVTSSSDFWIVEFYAVSVK